MTVWQIETFEHLIAVWQDLVGCELAALSRPVAFVHVTGCLVVRVSEWRQEFSAITPGLLRKLPAQLCGIPVRTVRWSIAPASGRARRFVGRRSPSGAA